MITRPRASLEPGTLATMSDRTTGWFSYVFGRGLRGGLMRDFDQQQQLDQLTQETRIASAGQESALDEVRTMKRVLTAQALELAELRVALRVLGELLVERGAVDEGVLDSRIADAIASDPSTRPPAIPKEGVACANCGLQYPGDQLVRTDAGVVCKRCRPLVAG
jgi:hypothetical protein